MDRIIMHWSAGGHAVSALDREHYHFIVDGGGRVHSGNKKPEANADTSDGNYVTEVQLTAFINLVSELADTYDIPVTRRTILSHAEVQPTLGIKQNGKWDFTWVVGMPAPGDPVEVGDMLRDLISKSLGIEPMPEGISHGERGESVREVQQLLTDNGYHLGTVDGHFGNLTRDAVLAYQADAGLPTNGIVTPDVLASLALAPERPLVAARGNTTVEDLRAKGSGTVAAADNAKKAALLPAGGAGALLLSQGSDIVEKITEAESSIAAAQEMLLSYWPIALVIAGVGLVWKFGNKVNLERVMDAREGKNIGR